MRLVEIRIFNALALREIVELPGIGTLWVDRIPAGLKGCRVTPPNNVVRFSTKERENARSIIDLLETSGAPGAESAYREWKDALTSLTSFEIEEVGRLRGKSFRISPELDAILNPEIPGYPAKLKRRRKFTGLWLSLAVILLFVAGFYMFCGEHDVMRCRKITGFFNDDSRVKTDNALSGVTAIMGNADDAEYSPEPDAAATMSSDPTIDTLETDKVDVPVAAQTATRYIVVGGVFSIAENADKYITRMKRKYPSLSFEYEKIPYKGNTVMVALYISDDMDDAQNRLREISRAASIRDLWIYRSEPE